MYFLFIKIDPSANKKIIWLDDYQHSFSFNVSPCTFFQKQEKGKFIIGLEENN